MDDIDECDEDDRNEDDFDEEPGQSKKGHSTKNRAARNMVKTNNPTEERSCLFMKNISNANIIPSANSNATNSLM